MRLPESLAIALPPDVQAPSQARNHVREFCAHLSSPVVQTATLLTSELVTNAVLHGEPDIALRVTCDDRNLRVEVSDGSPQPPVARDMNPTALSGRGLLILRALASRYGTEGNPAGRGKTVWFELHGR